MHGWAAGWSNWGAGAGGAACHCVVVKPAGVEQSARQRQEEEEEKPRQRAPAAALREAADEGHRADDAAAKEEEKDNHHSEVSLREEPPLVTDDRDDDGFRAAFQQEGAQPRQRIHPASQRGGMRSGGTPAAACVTKHARGEGDLARQRGAEQIFDRTKRAGRP